MGNTPPTQLLQPACSMMPTQPVVGSIKESEHASLQGLGSKNADVVSSIGTIQAQTCPVCLEELHGPLADQQEHINACLTMAWASDDEHKLDGFTHKGSEDGEDCSHGNGTEGESSSEDGNDDNGRIHSGWVGGKRKDQGLLPLNASRCRKRPRSAKPCGSAGSGGVPHAQCAPAGPSGAAVMAAAEAAPAALAAAQEAIWGTRVVVAAAAAAAAATTETAVAADGGASAADSPQQPFCWKTWQAELQRGACPVPLAIWLGQLRLPHLLPLFQAHEVDEVALPLLEEHDFLEMGIGDSSIRSLIMRSVSELCGSSHPRARQQCAAPPAPPPSAAPSNIPHFVLNPPPMPLAPACATKGCCQQPAAAPAGPGPAQSGPKQAPMFNVHVLPAPRITDFMPASSSAGPCNHPARPLQQQQQQQQQGMPPLPDQDQDQEQQQQTVLGGGCMGASRVDSRRPSTGHQGRAASLLLGVPRCHTLPGTRFCVDYFKPKEARKVRNSNGFWVLTHFHADHYMGLSKTFSLGTVVCSPVTAQLVMTKLKVPASKIVIIPLDKPTLVDGVTLTLLDANHCPGAVMVVAEVPGRPPVIHTGDCRVTAAMQNNTVLQAMRPSKPILVLDTTYCSPQYTFPSQADTLQYTLNAVKAELHNPRVLFVFGTYTIGKERIFLEVAHKFSKKVYVNKDKMQILQCCGLTPDYASLLTTNHLEANLHAVPLSKVSNDGLSAILQDYRGRYNTVVGVRPTGWALQSKRGKALGNGRRSQKGQVIIHEVPYSEHSSFSELREFVSWMQPGEIIPSVFPGNDRGNGEQKPLNYQEAAAELVRLLTGASPQPAAQKKPLGCKPITAFLSKATHEGL